MDLIDEYIKWSQNKKIDPITGNKIRSNSKIYKKYNLLNINELYIKECINDIDPISHAVFWSLENNEKIIKYENLDNLIFYKDSSNKIRGFEKSTIEYMKGYNIVNDPITGEKIPDYVFENIISNKYLQEKTIDEIAFDIFQLLNNESIFIDHKLFLSLNKQELIKLYHETFEFYNNNLPIKINNTFELSRFDLERQNIQYIQNYILENMKILLELNNHELKQMILYIIVGALSLVIPSISENYPHFSFDF